MIGKFYVPAGGGGGTYTKVLREYTTSGTWTKPAGLVALEVVCIGGGGGGASGARRASGVVSRGGGGGSSGGVCMAIFEDADLAGTENYTIGAGGAGGAAQSVDDSANIAGSNGTATTFGTTTLISAGGGFGANNTGNGGATFASATRYTDINYLVLGGIASLIAGVPGSGGGGEYVQALTQNWSNVLSASPGGGVGTANTTAAGNIGSRYLLRTGSLSTNVAGGTAGGGAGGAGIDGAGVRQSTTNTMHDLFVSKSLGSSGSGGGGATTTTGGNGGNGGLYGGPGAGGGGSRNTYNSGKGGDGANGLILLVEHIVS